MYSCIHVISFKVGGVNSNDTFFLGIHGHTGCSMFDIVGHTYVGGNCTENRSFDALVVTQDASALSLGEHSYGSCTPAGYTGNNCLRNVTLP